MRLTIPLSPPSLDDAFAFIHSFRQRTDLDPEPLMTETQWDQAVTAAVTRADRDGLATLLQVELVPAIARAMVAMGDTVRCALFSPEHSPDAPLFELVHHLEPTQRLMMRAGKAIWAGEHREGLLPEHSGPPHPRPDSSERVWAKMATYLHLELASEDVHQAIGDDLALALRKLTGPARAAVECVDAGEIDDLRAYPLQQALFEAFHALSAVRLHLLALRTAQATAERVLAEEL